MKAALHVNSIRRELSFISSLKSCFPLDTENEDELFLNDSTKVDGNSLRARTSDIPFVGGWHVDAEGEMFPPSNG